VEVEEPETETQTPEEEDGADEVVIAGVAEYGVDDIAGDDALAEEEEGVVGQVEEEGDVDDGGGAKPSLEDRKAKLKELRMRMVCLSYEGDQVTLRADDNVRGAVYPHPRSFNPFINPVIFNRIYLRYPHRCPNSSLLLPIKQHTIFIRINPPLQTAKT
jgi:hypothetical protein